MVYELTRLTATWQRVNGPRDHGTIFGDVWRLFLSAPKKIDNQKYHRFQFGKRILLFREIGILLC